MDQPLENGQLAGEANPFEVPEGTKFNIQLDIPEAVNAEDGDSIFIRHIKEDGTVYYDEATVIRGKVTFVNTHGFSEFDVSTGEYGEDPQFSSKSLILGDKIGVSFYMDIPEEYQGGTMYFDISGKGGCTASSDGEYIKNNGQYKFVCYVNSLQMAGKITAKYVKELADGTEYKTIDEYSVVDYLTGEAVQLGTSKMKKLASKMYAYGYYAQQYLSRVKDSVKLGISADSYAPMTELGAAPDLTKDLSSYKMEVSANGNTKLKDNPMISLSLDSEIGMKLYMELSGDSSYGSDNKPNVTIDGEAIDSSKITFGADGSGNAQMIIPIDNIQVSRLGHRFNVVVDDTYTIKASALAYANALKNQDDDFAKKLGAALYEYYEATMRYANLALE